MPVEIPKQPTYPSFVLSESDQSRWDLSMAIAEETSRQNEPDGRPNSQFVFYYARTVFFSPLVTGDPSELAEDQPLTEATGTPDESLGTSDDARRWRELYEADWPTALERGPDLLAELERVKPGPDAPDDEQWAHVGRVCDLLDAMFGNPDDIDVDGGIVEGGDGLTHLEEAFSGVVRRAYAPTMHPRDRMGKWSAKLNGLRSFARQHSDRVKMHLAAGLAGASLHHGVARADNPGGALHGDVTAAHDREKDAAARLKAHANEARNREGLRGAKQQAVHAHRVTKGHAIAALGYVYGGKAEEQLGAFHEPLKDAAAAHDRLDQIKDSPEVARRTSELAHGAARYAVEHRHELHAVVRVAGHVAHEIAKAKGLSAADDTPPDDDEAVELADWAVESVLA